MTTTEINVLLTLRKKSVTKIANAIKEDRTAVSQTINYLRENPHIRKKVADHLGMPVEELFDTFTNSQVSREWASEYTRFHFPAMPIFDQVSPQIAYFLATATLMLK